jgi:hypothetical protein
VGQNPVNHVRVGDQRDDAHGSTDGCSWEPALRRMPRERLAYWIEEV